MPLQLFPRLSARTRLRLSRAGRARAVGIVLALLPAARAAEGWSDPEAGLPVIARFPPSAYQAQSLVSDVLVARDGRLYGTTQLAVVRFDGTRWERLPFPSLWSWRLDQTDDGRIYVGGNDEVGYYAEEPDGTTPYHSLNDAVPREALPLGAVRGTRAAGNAAAFACDKGWLVWHEGKFVFRATPGATRTYVHRVGDTLYAAATNTGLHRWAGGAWQPLPLPEAFARTPVTALATLPGGELVAMAGAQGAYRISADGRDVSRFGGAGGKALADNQAHLLLTLPDGRLAANTRQHGLLLVSADGASFLQIDRGRGMSDATTVGLAVDAAQGLWLGSTNGLARVSIDPALSVFDERNGVTAGSVRGFARAGGALYASVLGGLQRLVPADPAAGAPARFETVGGAPRGVTDLAAHRDGLLVTTYGALHQLGPDGTWRALHRREEDIYQVSAPEKFPERVLLGTEHGCVIGELRGGAFDVLYETTETGPVEMVRHLDDGSILLGTRGRGFWHFFPGARGWREPRHEVIGEKEGLPPTRSWTAPFLTPLGLRFHTANGTWRFDEAARRFTRDPAFAEDGRDRYAYPGTTDSRGRHWASGGFIDAPFERRLGWFDFADPARAAWHEAPAGVQAVLGNLGPLFLAIDPAEPQRTIIWTKSPEAVVRFDADALATAPRPAWRPALRRVWANARRQPLAGGAAVFRHSPEPVAFDFSSGRLDGGAVVFQTRVLGFDERWTDLAGATLSLTNLSGGPFTLEYRARDLTGRLSAVGRYTFSITPPWYRRPAAFLLYSLALGGGVLGFVRWRLARSERERARLEGIVAERTRDLATARDQAEAASRAKSAFLAAMSHELRTPLNGVIGYAQLLQSDARLAKDQRERLRIVHQSGEHLLRMINDVLDLAKIEAGKIELRPAPFALDELIGDVCAAHAPAAAAKRLAFHRDLAPGLPAWVEGDAQKLRQVLDNLIGNAVKFTARGGVTLRVRREGGAPSPASVGVAHLVFAVVDTGPGIAPADQAKLFRPFEQARAARPAAPGTGLGLAISRALVERMGGTLTLASESGVGSTFSFSVSLAELPAPATSPARAAVTGYEGPRRRILIVDDHAVNRSLLVDLLAPLGFACGETASGEEALARLEAGTEPWPELAIVDLRMEGIDGLELTRRLRQRAAGRSLKVLLTSASVISFNPAEAHAAGCDDFLPKPFRTADLVEKIGALLGLRWIEHAVVTPRSASPFAPTRLPEQARQSLRDVLAQGDLEAFRAAVAQVRAAYPALAERWDELDTAAAGFQLSRLRQLLDQP